MHVYKRVVHLLVHGAVSVPHNTTPCIAFDRCQWQWCEITSGFESNPILASSLNGTPWPLHRKLLFSLLEGYCHGDLLDSISWRTINSGNCWCLQIPRAECFHSLAYTNNNREWWVGELQSQSEGKRSGRRGAEWRDEKRAGGAEHTETAATRLAWKIDAGRTCPCFLTGARATLRASR